MASNGVQEAAECYIKRDFGGGKGAVLEIRQAWRGGGDREVAELDYNAGSDWPRDDETETGNSHVGK